MDDLVMRGIIFFALVSIGGALYKYISKKTETQLSWYKIIIAYLLGLIIIFLGISISSELVIGIGFVIVVFGGLLMFGKMFSL